MLVSRKDYSGAGIPRYFLIDENEKNMIIDPQFKKDVVFIGCRVKNDQGVEIEHWGGTAFFVSMPLNPRGRATYLITAKHNIDGIKKMLVGNNNQNSIIRINKHDGTAQTVNVPLNLWKFHPTEEKSVDVAVAGIVNLSQTEFDYLSLPTEWAVDKTRIGTIEGFNEGDDVSVIGLFKYHVGNKKNYPIFRAGNIALFPDEKVYINKKIGEAEMYLIESRSLKGLSGSPVLVSLNPFYIKAEGNIVPRPGGSTVFFWLGLVSGHFLTDEGEIDFAANINEDHKLNVGISFVVPAQKIVEIINSKVFRDERDRIEKHMREKEEKNTTLD